MGKEGRETRHQRHGGMHGISLLGHLEASVLPLPPSLLAYLLPYPSLPSPSSIQTDKQRRLHFSSPESNGESREREQTEEEEDWMDGFRKEGRGGG